MKLTVALVPWIAVAALAAAAGAVARPLAPLGWSVAGFVDHQPPYGGGAPRGDGTPMGSISCPSATLCVAGDAFGKLAISTNPAAGPAGWHVEQTGAGIVPLSSGIGAISCPSTSLCVALDPAGDVLTSTHPARGGSGWRVTHVEGSAPPGPFTGPSMTAVTCPSTSLCVAADRNGNMLTSTSPATGRWRSVSVDHSPGFFGITAISCPTTGFCAATDGSGRMITSTRPTGGASAWKVQDIDGSNELFGVSCASAAMCVAVDRTAVLSTTGPTGGASAWHRAVVDPTSFWIDAVHCPTSSLCVAGDRSGNVITSTNPTAGASAWRVDAVDPASSFAGGIPPLSGLTALSCPSTSFCAFVDSIGHLVRSANPTGGTSAWTIEQIDGRSEPIGIACPSAGCVAVDGDGNVLSSTRPADPSSWTVTAVDDTGTGTGGPGAVSCPSAAFCAAVDSDANVLAGSNPLSHATWRSNTADPGHTLASVSCPSSSLCVAVDEAGNAVTSTDPADTSPAWTVSHADVDVTPNGDQAALTDVSCPSLSLCVAVDSAGNVLSSTNPAGGPAAWTATAVGEGTALTTVSCPSISLCIVAGGATIVVSTAPAAATQSWTAGTVPSAPTSFTLQRMSCTTTSLCVGTDGNGDVLSSDNPAAGGPSWKLNAVQQYGITAVTCSAAAWCYALDGVGNVLLGAQPRLTDLIGGSLRMVAVPPSGARRIGRVLAVGGHGSTWAPPVPGRLSITWRQRGTRTTLAVAHLTGTGVQPQFAEVALTRTGKRILRHAQRVAVVATATYTTQGTAAVTVTAGFTLRR